MAYYTSKNSFNSAMLQSALKANAMKMNNIARMAAKTKEEPIRTTAKIKADLSFIISVTNLTAEDKPYILFDADGQYAFNDPNAPTNEGIEIVGEKKNYKAILNQLIGNSYQIVEVNVETAAGSPLQLNQSIKIWTNSQDNDANIFVTSINPSLFKNSQQYLPNLIETSDNLNLDMFSAWTSVIKAETTFTYRIFMSYVKSFR